MQILHAFKNVKHQGDYLLFSFKVDDTEYMYDGFKNNPIERI